MEELLAAPRVNEDEQVLSWRFDVLDRAGFEPVAALALATTAHVDVHAAVELLARGCPRETALRILI
jgi:hypothetical protein